MNQNTFEVTDVIWNDTWVKKYTQRYIRCSMRRLEQLAAYHNI